VDWNIWDRQYKSEILPILKSACYDCHQGAEADAGLALTHFDTSKSIMKERRTWQHVIQRVELGEMPPPDEGDISKEDSAKLVGWVRELLDDIDCGGTPNPGAVTLRRLNRNEYQNTVRDLLGVNYTPASDFPGDDVGYGFDNIGDVLTLPPLLMEKYLTAAEAIATEAILAPEPGNVFEVSANGGQLKTDKPNGGNSELTLASSGSATLEAQTPWTGRYRLELELSGDQGGDEPALASVHVGDKVIRTIQVPNDREQPEVYTVPLRLGAGKREVRISFDNDFYVAKTGDQEQIDRNLHIHNVRLFGTQPTEPLDPNSLPKSHKFLITSTPNRFVTAEAATRKVLQPIASRAFRRPVTGDEFDRLVGLALDSQENGDSFEGSIQLALQAILISPHFLFRVEDPAGVAEGNYPTVDQFELATRLSYFIWSTMPDDRLLALAVKGTLGDKDVIKSEVRRMILDRRANAFVENFAGQWLTLRGLENFEPDRRLFPQWKDSTKNLLRQETFTFFAEVMREDMSVMALLDAPFTYLNEELAEFYGIEGVEGSQFRRVSTQAYPRRGLLTQGAILAVTSNPTRTSPVKRGKWILDNLLNDPPPPAPPNVPELEKGELVGTLRERIEQHRADPACASCHRLMDPLGLALENFNAIGLWRTEDAGERIDASGTLPGGIEVKHAGDLVKSLRVDNEEKFARCLTEKMLTFAIGRGMEYYDKCAVDEIVSKLKADDYKFSTLVTEIVTSDPFRRRGVKELD
jgi:hypothetical protein